MLIGIKKSKLNITDIHNALAVSPGGIIIALQIARKKRAATWFDEKFPYRETTPNGNIILISRTCCEYNP